MIEDLLHARFFVVKASHPFVLVSCGEHSMRYRPVQTLCGTPVANVTLCVNHMSMKKTHCAQDCFICPMSAG